MNARIISLKKLNETGAAAVSPGAPAGFLSHKDEPNNKYNAYLAEGASPRDQFSNTRNLFDDSNREDQRWLKTAMDYLGRRR